VLTIRMVRGQTPADFQKATANLAYAFGRRHARVYSERPDDPPTRAGRGSWLLGLVDRLRFRDRPSVVYLVLVRTDALRTIVPPFPPAAVPDFTALPLARREDLRTWHLHLLATHVLVGGATRRGKGSVLWSLVRAMANGVTSGLVRLWVIDPKGGMEFAMGRPMFARFACKSFEAMADLLDEAVDLLRERQTRLAGAVRVHTPTETDPLAVVVIDEMSTLTAYLQDGDLRKRIAASLGLLLSQGAGVGVLVVAALQDPRKEVLPFRDLFPTRIALGLTEESQVDMVLGDGARNRGALADQMPRWAKGVGYVILDGTPDPMRVRFSYLTDDDIRDMARQYPAPADAADILAQVGRETTPEPTRPARPPLPRKPVGPLLPESLLNILDRDTNRGEA
jgi:S-DNA-T family DNA segregation ATPase FtsK/SpoIIIE